jgi:hypothetical protein
MVAVRYADSGGKILINGSFDGPARGFSDISSAIIPN